MKLNANLKKRIVINTSQLPWTDSPSVGVKRRMLERDGQEIARATSIVRYAPDSFFSTHIHGGGEEFLVLEGIFADEYGEYSSGTYVRNPVGSKHTPYSQDGCMILVKLWQMNPEDQQRVIINTKQVNFRTGLAKGIEVIPLHTFGTENVALVKWSAGTTFAKHQHWGGEEIFVLQGVLEDEQGIYPQGTWLRNPPQSVHQPFSREGCLIYVKTGHLDD